MRINLFKLMLVVAVLILLVVAYYGFFRNKDDEATIRDYTFQLEIADSEKELSRGLSGKDKIEDDEAMLFLFGQRDKRVFWMKDMKFDIDLLWISGDIVVGYEENMRAPSPGASNSDLQRYYSEDPVDKVLEMNAGLIDQIGIEIGDRIIIN